mmetsp:Transcript_23890/g.36113  ORF Transcript_23890/g.36113 Transcript_23890/m.36113 type:complete len:177 (-) Transcript_23890:56-586(-)|eukprot:CAMPEP_0195001158 /NCGR_PEP_ID=MMETSP0326_2-20130528/1060_1 /TAXON_ID=2866 ORGANISM="Crypthecodinium cohnii, Strain Seligo" /NCGR_SAMPLE_ID=MMETSP0326_2 /ASSEMBLY_ACC=CAM_ASM_000348 /LENGTH=176 /DNA_ID=CAMNT_0040003371 /DNA_START=225 /DNA_END=755 /DNA_ORIENTATION=+
MPDLYEVLGVDRDARQAQIKQAYMGLVKQMHPDKHHGTDLEEGSRHAFGHLQKAYKILSDPKLRKEYDAATAFGRGEAEATLQADPKTFSPTGHSWLPIEEQGKKRWFDNVKPYLNLRKTWRQYMKRRRVDAIRGKPPSLLGSALFVGVAFVGFLGIPYGMQMLLDSDVRRPTDTE